MKSIFDRRAARGAKFMDQVLPGWFNEVDSPRLDIDSGQDCVWGQIYGHYTVGCKQHGILDGGLRVRYGFVDGVGGLFFPVGLLLTRAWRREIEKRRVQAVFAPAVPSEEFFCSLRSNLPGH